MVRNPVNHTSGGPPAWRPQSVACCEPTQLPSQIYEYRQHEQAGATEGRYGRSQFYRTNIVLRLNPFPILFAPELACNGGSQRPKLRRPFCAGSCAAQCAASQITHAAVRNIVRNPLRNAATTATVSRIGLCVEVCVEPCVECLALSISTH